MHKHVIDLVFSKQNEYEMINNAVVLDDKIYNFENDCAGLKRIFNDITDGSQRDRAMEAFNNIKEEIEKLYVLSREYEREILINSSITCEDLFREKERYKSRKRELNKR